jgi:ribonuclease J
MNVYLYGLGTPGAYQWLMVDCGVTFPDAREPGVDIVLPNLCFIEEERRALAGVLLTHSHEDHFGAVAEMWPRLGVPVYGTRFTIAMLREKLAEYPWRDEVPLIEVPIGGKLSIGPFNIELVNMAHSIPEASGVVIRTPFGTLLHSGDWKLDPDPGVGEPTDEAKLRTLGDEGVDVLVCDSTNILSEGSTASEAIVSKSLADIIKKVRGRVAVTSFASSVARLLGVTRAAKAAGRDVVLVGRSMHRIVEIARETGLWPENLKTLTEEDFGHIPPANVLALMTGSQGERRAALARIADDQHPLVSLARGDTVVFSARTIPGNEEAVNQIQNKLADRGVEMVTEWPDGPIHSSGHPHQGEVAQLYEWVRPKVLVPMHGEPRHLETHVAFARSHGIEPVAGVRNGAITRLMPGDPEIVDEAPVGRIYRDGRLLVPEDHDTIRERRKLSFVGTIMVSLVLKKGGEMAVDPQFTLIGLPEEDANGMPLASVVEQGVWNAFDSIPRSRRKDPGLLAEAVRKSVRSAINSVWGKKPICTVMVAIV